MVGDVNAHAPTLAQVKRELKQLNLCGGATSAAEATPLVKSSLPGFIADPGTSQTQGELPQLTAALNALGKALDVTIYGISGYRSPAHSVAVGGFANDPHTQGKAEDIGVNSLLRSSAAQISEAELARFGLYRPFDPSDDPNNSEVNHIQLIPSGGPLTLAQATSRVGSRPELQVAPVLRGAAAVLYCLAHRPGLSHRRDQRRSGAGAVGQAADGGLRRRPGPDQRAGRRLAWVRVAPCRPRRATPPRSGRTTTS